jgi:hypothetical protein
VGEDVAQADDSRDLGNALRGLRVRLAQPVQRLADDLQLALDCELRNSSAA